jgi:hypothetical protein
MQKRKKTIVSPRMYECSKLMLAIVLGPYEKEANIEKRKNENHRCVFLGMYECSKFLLAIVLRPPETKSCNYYVGVQ